MCESVQQPSGAQEPKALERPVAKTWRLYLNCEHQTPEREREAIRAERKGTEICITFYTQGYTEGGHDLKEELGREFA